MKHTSSANPNRNLEAKRGLLCCHFQLDQGKLRFVPLDQGPTAVALMAMLLYPELSTVEHKSLNWELIGF